MHRRHLQALFHANLTSLRTRLAMLHGMPTAHLFTRLAHIRTKLTNRHRAFAAAAHGGHCQLAQLRAIEVQHDATRQSGRVRLLQASVHTLIASDHAGMASFHAAEVLILRHECILK